MKTTMKIAVCDGRREDRTRVRELLEAYQQESGSEIKHLEIREYASGAALCADDEFLQSCKLLFLDINMEAMEGLRTARQIKEKYPAIHVILVTACMNYALDGYKVKASRFLLKEDLEQTLGECMDDILKEIGQESQTITLDFVEGKIQLRADEIIYIETNKHKNVFYTQNRVLNIYKKMDELEEALRGMGFLRIHQSFLINMRYIVKISSYLMTLTTGKEISVPKSRYPEVKRQYTLFKTAL
ncbi:MAG: LytTR family DNA-binding domain-containing protein [Lachnospiraceae bacterium]|jgi:DNA-binding LytR/AlgR family response regulator